MPDTTDSDDLVLKSLDRLLEATVAVEGLLELVRVRAAFIKERRAAGLSYRDIVPLEDRPLVVEVTTEAIIALSSPSADFRRAEASALHQEGLTMDEIASAFGISRQRVSYIMRRDLSDQ